MSETMKIDASCTICGATFSMTDKADRVMDAYKVWDSEHKHTDQKEQPHV